MKKILLVCAFAEFFLLGFSCYFFATSQQPITNHWMDTTHAVIGIDCIMFQCINIIVAYVVFSKYTNKYPKNASVEFSFDPQTSQLGNQGNGNYVIEFIEVEDGIWETPGEENKIKFDMRGYVCPKLYICTYFIRNLHYAVINKNKYPLIKLFKSLNLHPYSKFQNFDLRFLHSGKIYTKNIVKKNKTNTTWLMRLILRSKYYIDFMLGMGVAEMRKTYVVNMTEEKYKNRKYR